MKLNQLRALEAVAQGGSLQVAAQLINLTQPAVSKSIRELERELGVALLLRSSKGATLTQYGTILLRRGRAIHKELEKIREEVAWLRGELGGRLLIGIVPPGTVTTAESAPITIALERFHKEHHAVDLQIQEMRSQQIIEALRDGAIDLGVILQYEKHRVQGLQYHELYDIDTSLVYAGMRADPHIAVGELAELEWLIADLTDEPDGVMMAIQAHYGARPTRIVRCSSVSLFFALAARLNTVSLLSHTAIEQISPFFDSSRLTRLKPSRPTPPMHIVLIYRDKDLLTPAASRFVQLLQASVAERNNAVVRRIRKTHTKT